MPTSKVNRIHIVFNAEHKPYIYGAIHKVDGSVDNQWWEKPFVVSKKRSDGNDVHYGTVKRTLGKIVSQLQRLEKFSFESAAKLEAAGITPLIQKGAILPESQLSHRILDEQDDLIEEVLLAISVDIRILSEIFPSKLRKRKVSVYDYDNANIGRIELNEIADLLLHNRYIVIKDQYVVDLMSDKGFMSDKPQMGLKFDFDEFISQVQKAISGLTVKDLVGKLWGITKLLSPSSSIKDIVFLAQNLYTLGDSVVGKDAKVETGPLKVILDKVAKQHLDRLYPPPGAARLSTIVTFKTPRFYLEPDLDQKQIRTEVEVNGSPETLVMDYEDFFSEVSKASGSRRLYTKPDR